VSRLAEVARDERAARHVGLWWGLAEGLFLFIVPDVYISFATLFSPRAGASAWLWSIGGSIAAVCLIYLLVETPGIAYLEFLESLPGISGALMQQVSSTLSQHGLSYSPLLALTGVPLKVYAATAFSLGLPLALVLIWTAYARLVRIAPTFVVAMLIRLIFRERIDARPALWSAILAMWWAGFYAFYFVTMARATR
jgi:hypothetical protein